MLGGADSRNVPATVDSWLDTAMSSASLSSAARWACPRISGPYVAESEIAGRAFEQAHTQLILELSDPAAHGRDRHFETTRRDRETSRFNHFCEDGQRVQVCHWSVPAKRRTQVLSDKEHTPEGRPLCRRLQVLERRLTKSASHTHKGLRPKFREHPCRRRCTPDQVNTTILPPALLSSMQRCASTMSSSLNTLPICTRNVPATTCSTSSSSGVSMKSSGPPS